MKSINILIVALILSITSIFATDFGSGPSVHARAYEKARTGIYYAGGSGTTGSYQKDVQYSSMVTNQVELLAPFNSLQYGLAFENYKSPVYERAYIYDENGNLLYSSDMSWKPIETLSPDGKTLSYAIPEYAGSIYFQLADRRVESDSEYIYVELEYGHSFSLEIIDGQIIIPGWVYDQKGVFVEWKNGQRYATDIQTGLPVWGGKESFLTKSSYVSGIIVLEPTGLYQSIYADRDWSTTFELTTQGDGYQNIWIGDQYGNSPQGLYITIVGSGLPAQYYEVQKGGYVYLPVKWGQTLHIVSYWGQMTGKG